MRQSALVRLAVCRAVAAMLAFCGWVWAELSWKLTGGSQRALGLASALFALFTLGAWGFTGRTVTRWRRFVLLFIPLLLTTCGSSCTSLSDFNPGGGVNYMFANNTPDNATPGFASFMLGATLIAWSALWPLTVFAREAASRALLTAGGWLLLALLATWLLGQLARVELGVPLLPLLLYAAALLAAGRSAGRTVAGVGLASCLLAALALGPWALVPGIGPPQDQRAFTALCAERGRGLVRSVRSVPVTTYAAPGLELRRVDCRTTLQFIDDPIQVVVGRGADGQLAGAALFLRVTGSPLERARAARDMLLRDRCDAVLPDPPPTVSGAELVFSCTWTNHLYGRGTHVGALLETRRFAVDLRTAQLTER